MTERIEHASSSQEAYDAWARTYDAEANPLVAMATLARARLAGVVRGARVLELGCGTGRNQPFFLAHGAARYVGIDESKGMLHVARGRPDDGRTEWRLGSMTDPLTDDVRDADLVYVCLALEHVEDLAPVFASAASAARAGARLVVHELHASLRNAGTRAHFVAGDREIVLPSFAHDGDEYARTLGSTGWELTTIADWYATSEAIATEPKLAKHRGRPVLVDVTARRAAR